MCATKAEDSKQAKFKGRADPAGLAVGRDGAASASQWNCRVIFELGHIFLATITPPSRD